jgi:hypothetical protein
MDIPPIVHARSIVLAQTGIRLGFDGGESTAEGSERKAESGIRAVKFEGVTV